MSKKRTFALAVVVCMLALAVGSTWAFFTARQPTHNVVTTGRVGIQIVEKTKDEYGTQLDFPAEGFADVMPATSVSKIVTVKNTAAGEAWVRIKAEIAIADPAGQPLPLQLNTAAGVVDAVAYTPAADWLPSTDGWYYYNTPVAMDGSTSAFFEEVAFAAQMGNDYQNSSIQLIVTAQAVQTANNPIPVGGTVCDVAGWPLG